MSSMAMLKKFWRDEDGGEAVEWPLIVALVAGAAIAAWATMGTQISAAFTKIVTALTTAAT